MDQKNPEDQAFGYSKEQHSVFSQIHILAYAVVVAIWSILHILIPKGWSIFWLMLFWGVVVLIHYLAVRVMNIDEKWVDERTADITYNTQDLSHIEAIRKGYDNRTSNIAARFNEKKSNKTSEDKD